MKVLELKGIKSLKALNVFHTLMLGVKMLPAYMGESYEDFFSRVHSMPEADQEKVIREAVLLVTLQPDEVQALSAFCTDANGVPFNPENINNLKPMDLVEMIIKVCLQIAKIDVGFVTEEEKKSP